MQHLYKDTSLKNSRIRDYLATVFATAGDRIWKRPQNHSKTSAIHSLGDQVVFTLQICSTKTKEEGLLLLAWTRVLHKRCTLTYRLQGLCTGLHMGSCQNYGPFLGTLNNRCRTILRTQKGDPNFDNHPYGAWRQN